LTEDEIKPTFVGNNDNLVFIVPKELFTIKVESKLDPKVAKELEISLQRAYDLLYLDKEVAADKLAEAKREREKFMRFRDKKVWQLRAKGMIQEDIADLLGIGASMVRAILDSDKVCADKLTDSIIKREQHFNLEIL